MLLFVISKHKHKQDQQMLRCVYHLLFVYHVSIANAINISVRYKKLTNPRIRNILLGYPDVDWDGD